MKIKNQLLISIILFFIVLAVISASIFTTQRQAAQLNSKLATALDIQTRAGNLAYLSNDFFLYQQNSTLDLWQIEYSFLTVDVSELNSSSPSQQTLLDSINDDALRLSSRWNDMVAYLQIAPRNASVRVLAEFQAISSRMTLQNQALIFDSQQLTQDLLGQIDRTSFSNVILIVALLGLFGIYFIVNYLIAYRKTLRSIAKLQTGITAIGSGNLDFPLEAENDDEVGEISKSIHQMTTNLKAVTASKEVLEMEIDERKKVEEALNAAQAKLQEYAIGLEQTVENRTQQLGDERKRLYDVLETLPVMVCLLTPDHHVAFANRSFREKFGESEGRHCYDFCFGNSEPCSFCESYRVLETGKPHHWEVNAPDGSVIDAYDFPFRDIDGSPMILEMDIDVTARRRSEERLRAYSSYSRNLIDASLDPLVTISVDGKITDVNRATEVVTGCSREELIGSDFSGYFTEPEKARAGYMKVFTAGSVRDYPLTIRSKKGEVKEVSYNAAVYRNEAGIVQGVFAAARDVTELKQMEKQVKDSERLAAIGTTAGMVGHDIRNPLQAIVGNVDLLKMELAALPEGEQKKNMKESLDEIENVTGYIDKIVLDLQDFARPLKPQVVEIDLEKLFKDLLEKTDVPCGIDVSSRVEKPARKMLCDPDFLRRIMLNLLSNAVQSMSSGGGTISLDAYRERKDVVIAVKDSGRGIPREIQSQLFTPLFTTKAKGQGFGLAVVKRMTEAMGGTVQFTSQEGKGTEFILRLPQR